MSKNKKSKSKPISTPELQNLVLESSSVSNPVNVSKFDIEHITGITGTWQDALCVCPWCNGDQFVYAFEDHQTFYCAECSEEFSKDDCDDYMSEKAIDTSGVTPNQYLSEEIAEVKKASEAAYQRGIDAAQDLNKQTQGNTSQIQRDIDLSIGITGKQKSFDNWKPQLKCCHAPQQLIAGKGWGVWAGTKSDCLDSARNYDVVMNLTFSSIKENHSIPIPELQKWENYSSPFIELQMDWPDYGVIGLPRAFWEDLITYLERNHAKLLVFCQGGHGRTGAAIACLMVTGLGYTAKQAIAWIRKNYCASAIESTSQENYIRKIARKSRKQDEPEVKAYEAESN